MISMNDTKENLGLVKAWLEKEYSSLHTGKATPNVLDSVMVEVYGARQPIKNVGSISAEDAKTLRISIWDKTQIGAIEKAIAEADLGLSASSDSGGIRVHFPALTEETRQKLVKVVRAKLEDARISVRKEREAKNSEIDSAFKEKEISEDDRKRLRESLQELVDDINGQLDKVCKDKEVSVMTI